MMSKMEIDFTDGPINPFHTDQQQEATQDSPSLESKANDGIKVCSLKFPFSLMIGLVLCFSLSKKIC